MQTYNFSDDYFKSGEIEGFYVKELMKRSWASFVKLLTIFEDYCSLHGIRYFVGYGTLLGAVRHQGFIPWDDDLDLWMLRPDYMKLIEALKKDTPEGCAIQSIYFDDPAIPEPLLGFKNRAVLWEDKQVTEDYFGCPFIVALDIFCMGQAPADDASLNTQRQLYNIVYEVASKYDLFTSGGEIESLLNQIESLTGVNINRNGDIRNQLWDLSREILTMYRDEECDKLFSIYDYVCPEKNIFFDKHWFDDVVMLPFEGGIKVPAPIEYEKVLIAQYGENYMTPVLYTSDHNYPFYQNQLDFLRDCGISIEDK